MTLPQRPTPGSTSSRKSQVVERTALLERLAAIGPDTVVLITAPAGSGKTTLVRSWIDRSRAGDRVAWVTVARDEHDEAAFWTDVVRQLRQTSGDEQIERLEPSPDFDALGTIERLLSNLERVVDPLTLVIDNLHELKSAGALARLETLIARRGRLRLVLITRHDPQLGLHRLRLAGQLLEIRAADLSFNAPEAAELLATSGVKLAPETLERLVARTEGWAAGLRLAGLSLRFERDPDHFVDRFSGSDRTVAEYLLAETLERQPDDVRDLLLRTSIVDRINGDLAEAITGLPSADTMLLDLELANAFVVEVAGEPGWFRYHQLLADLLTLELRRRYPDAVPGLHLKAADWYELHGDIVRAVRHVQAAGEWPRAEGLLVDHVMSLVLDGRWATVSELLRTFPAARQSSPALAIAYAGVELVAGSLDSAESYLSVAQNQLGNLEADRRRAQETVLTVERLTIARRRGDFDKVAAEVKSLLEQSNFESSKEVLLSNDARVVALADLGTSELWAYQLADAERHLSEGLALAQRINRPYIAILCLTHLGLLAAGSAPGTLRRRASEAVALADMHGWSTDPVVVPALVSMALADVTQLRSDQALEWLARAQLALRPDADPANAFFVHVVNGMERMSRKEFASALERFRAAEQLHSHLAAPRILGIQLRELLVHALLRTGNIGGARAVLADWPSEAAVQELDWTERRVAEADLLLAEGNPAEALESLANVSAGRTVSLLDWTTIAAFILEARAHERRSEKAAARDALERALDLAEIESRVFPFTWFEVRDLLEQQPRRDTAHAALIPDLIDLLDGRLTTRLPGQREELIEPLSESELRVLRFLPGNLSAPEIGAEIFVSTSTVKTHMRHIYEKLGVHRRNEAVDRARELGLLGPSVRQR